MDPSSLVFLAIIGVWAAYLVPTWLRRRVQLAQSRTRDRFSSGVRVLNRRRTVRRGGAGHRSGDAVLTAPAAVAPAAVAPAPVAAPPPVPHVTATVASSTSSGVAAATASSGVAGATDAGASRSASEGSSSAPGRRAGTASEADQARARTAQREAHIAHVTAVERARVAASRRARVMVTLLLLTAAAWAVSVTTASPLWAGLPVTTMLVLHMLAGRLAAVRSQRALSASGRRLDVARRRLEAATATPTTAAPQPAQVTVAPTPAREGQVGAAVGGETWVPVPVPPPTYTLKPAVHRPEPAPLSVPAPAAAAAAAAPAPAPAAVAQESGGVYDDHAVAAAGGADRSRAGASRAALPRRAEEVERILDLDALERRAAVNG